MAQMTKDMAQRIVDANGAYPLTDWEIKQLAFAWLERDAAVQDAERYRFLRRVDSVYPAPSYVDDVASDHQIDSKVDQAMKDDDLRCDDD
jgi:hypothetical protein